MPTEPHIFAKIRVVACDVGDSRTYKIGDIGVIMKLNGQTGGAYVKFPHQPKFHPYLYRREFEVIDD